MFTVAICDDDKIVLSSIQKCIEEFATENNISISVDLYDSGKKLLESSLKYNVIFLDIILQTENGIDIGTHSIKLSPALRTSSPKGRTLGKPVLAVGNAERLNHRKKECSAVFGGALFWLTSRTLQFRLSPAPSGADFRMFWHRPEAER